MQVHPKPLEWPLDTPSAKPVKVSLGQKARDVIAAVAPTLGTVLGGPLGGLAGVILARVFGTSSSAAIDTAIAAQNPEALVKIKEAEAQLQIELAKLDVDLEKISAEDRASARHLAEVRGVGPQVAMSAVFIIGYFCAFALFLVGDLAPVTEYANTVQTLVGALTTVLIMIMTYWFGSSSGSQAKSDVISSLAKDKQV
jgi:hypothetical protein